MKLNFFKCKISWCECARNRMIVGIHHRFNPKIWGKLRQPIYFFDSYSFSSYAHTHTYLFSTNWSTIVGTFCYGQIRAFISILFPHSQTVSNFESIPYTHTATIMNRQTKKYQEFWFESRWPSFCIFCRYARIAFFKSFSFKEQWSTQELR